MTKKIKFCKQIVTLAGLNIIQLDITPLDNTLSVICDLKTLQAQFSQSSCMGTFKWNHESIHRLNQTQQEI